MRFTWFKLLLLAMVGWTVGAKEAPQGVSLPMTLVDDFGVRWDVQPDGCIGDGGNDIYDGGGRLYLDNRMMFRPTGVATFDRTTNEIAIAPFTYKGLSIGRRVAVNKAMGFCRWAEVIENPTGAKVSLQLRVQFDLGVSIQQVEPFVDPKRKKTIGVALTQGMHHLAVVAVGRDAKLSPRLEPRPRTDQVDLYYEIEVPARQTVVVVHVQGYRRSLSEATKFIAETREREYTSTLPAELQRQVINFRVGAGKTLTGEYELLRGETTDVIELRVSRLDESREPDMLRGRLAEPTLTIRTAYGDFTFRADDVVGLLNPRAVTPRQLLVTKFGEIFFGKLTQETLAFEMAGGRVVQVPLGAISRVGCRPRDGEPEEWKLDRPMALLRAGDRVNVFMPAEPLKMSTRYGVLSLPTGAIASVELRLEEMAAHQVTLRDGSRITGLVNEGEFDLKLAGEALPRSVSIPTSAFERLQFAPGPEGVEASSAVLVSSSGDQLVGALEGSLSLDSAYDSITIECGEIRQMRYVGGAGNDVEVVLWDDSLLRGHLRQAHVQCRLLSGVVVHVPVPMVANYYQPRPSPSPHVLRKIEALVRELDSNDWRRRNVAQGKLRQLGPIALGPLRAMYANQSPETQQRIELILPELEARGRRNGESLP